MADQDRNPDGTFKKQGEDTAPPPAREIESVEDMESFGLDEGLSESEGADRLDDLLQAAAETEGDDPPEGVDPEMWDSAREFLEDTGSIDAAAAALEESLKGTEAAEEGAEEGAGEAIPFEALAEEHGLDPDSVLVTAKVDGEELEVPLSEMQNGYQRQKDYTKKTTELADQRREVQELQEAYAQELEAIAVTMGDRLNPEQQQALRERYNAVVGEIEARTQKQMAGSVQEEAQTLREKMGWDDSETWDEARTNLRSYVTGDAGFSEEEASMVHDHRLLVLAEKARRYDQLAEQGEALVSERPKQSGETLTPGDKNPGRGPRSKRRKKVSDARKKVRRTGRAEDAAAAILESGII